MFFNAKSVSLLLALCIGGITSAFLSLIPDVSITGVIVGLVIAFSSSFLLTYFILEFIFFKEVGNIHRQIHELRSNQSTTFEVSNELVKSSKNPISGIKSQIRDYAEMKEEEIAQLKKMERYRKEFLANISHELKTPIFATQGFILTLLDGAVDDKKVRDRFLKKAAKSLNALNILVEDLLTVSKIEAGEISMDFEVFDIQIMIVDVLEQVEQKAEKKNITVSLEVPNDDPIYVNADYNRLKQVVINLVVNGIKYNEKGGWVNVILQVHDNLVTLLVKDNGMGIPLEDQNRIFERFYRVEKSRTKKQGGSGLGLAICKHILEQHNTSITLQSEAEVGSTFSFDLNLVQDTEYENSEF
ncbi:sensor histidine kinase [Flammeovirga kamogawensis]|uniref:histidine kinase n=1 Tax=Flammeovirga kamogawensis TaxID=373891 RepID=A0ABX8GV83_9BACT|nr:ATP-binding protein [Flammeovirga kamogawensis]MBB6461568.1 two-component system phosphate regulon sensor histidine kinase PhoR [Flammeovirga kamogawensis]QWG07500.1 two-component sensor histidine kinase [Flammeovirga kamogawensis]TRX69313.1 two-component sensor histidine kinase [Flammeovirga kamogawensis]